MIVSLIVVVAFFLGLGEADLPPISLYPTEGPPYACDVKTEAAFMHSGFLRGAILGGVADSVSLPTIGHVPLWHLVQFMNNNNRVS